MNRPLRIIFPVSMDSVKVADDIFEVLANNATRDARLCYNIRTVLSEAFNNAFLYSEKGNLDAVIEVRTCFNKNDFFASIINEGRGFADNEIKWDKFPSIEEESGRGLKIIKKLCDKLEFRRTENNKFEIYVAFNTNTSKQKIK